MAKSALWWQRDALKWLVLALCVLITGYLVVLMYAQGEYLFAIVTLILLSSGLIVFSAAALRRGAMSGRGWPVWCCLCCSRWPAPSLSLSPTTAALTSLPLSVRVRYCWTASSCRRRLRVFTLVDGG